MSWNYRVVEDDFEGEKYFGIHEVYYDTSGQPESCSELPARVSAESLEGVRGELVRMLEALEKPPLPASLFGDESATKT